MEPVLQDLYTLGVLIFVLGLKHGFDADHLATIDGLTRFNAQHRPRLAGMCGALFSLGHGTVVIAIALAVSMLAREWQAPHWLEAFGAWVSIAFLATLGMLNLHAVVSAAPGEIVRPVGLKGRWLGHLSRASSPGLVAVVGALFALSFDTVSQAALFAVTATQFGGWQHALMLGLLFMLGMLVTDGINGIWISRLIRRADRIALVASRAMSLVVAGISLLVAGFGLAKLAAPAVRAWAEGMDMFLGAAVIGVIALSYVFSVRMVRGPATAAAAAD